MSQGWAAYRRDIKKSDDNFLRSAYHMSGGRCSPADIEYFENMPISRWETLRDVHNEAQAQKADAMRR
jgi:uncharacterized protein YbjQ (UPF0145 family)